MVDTLKQNLKEKSTWLRGLYMLLFILFISVAKVVILAVIIFQFISELITRKANQDGLSVKDGPQCCDGGDPAPTQTHRLVHLSSPLASET